MKLCAKIHTFSHTAHIKNPNIPHSLFAVNDTFRRAMKEWKPDVEYVTELALVPNHKIWQHYKQRHLMS